QPGASRVNGYQGRLRAIQYAGSSHSHSFGSISQRISGASVRGRQPPDQATINGTSGIISTASAFIDNARARSPWTSACSARVNPQPMHQQPVKARNMHGGKGFPATFGSQVRSAHTPAPA